MRCFGVASVLVAVCATAVAQPLPTGALELVPKIDGPVIAIAGAGWLSLALAQKAIVDPPRCVPCDASTINPFDRPLAGRRDAVANAVSWTTAALTLAVPLAIDAGDVARSHVGWARFGHDVGIYAEAIALNGVVNEIVKLAVRRPRPLVYDASLSTSERARADSYVSFYSEHSSVVFAAASAYTTIFALRHRDRPGLSALVGTGLFALAATTASLRVVAGKHFYSDVIVGSAIGTAIGATVPLLHYYVRRKLPVGVAVVPIAGGALLTLSRAE